MSQSGLDSVIEGVKCEGCEERPSLYYCKECQKNLCNSCYTQIHSIKNFKTHQTDGVRKRLYCAKHSGKVIEKYCVTCQEGLCVTCLDPKTISTKHKDHSIKDEPETKEILRKFLVNKKKAVESALKTQISNEQKLQAQLQKQLKQSQEKESQGLKQLEDFSKIFDGQRDTNTLELMKQCQFASALTAPKPKEGTSSNIENDSNDCKIQ